jgi:hypothetical protein
MDRSARDLLIHQVQYGEISPEQAEAEAARLGLAPLASKPDRASFNPMDETWWSLVMATAWIAWRSPERILEFYDPYRTECWDWHFRKWRVGFDGPVHAGYFLEQRRPATLTMIAFFENYDRASGIWPADAIGIRDAKAQLWKALGEAAVRATGIDRHTGERMPIPDYAWHDFEDFDEDGRVVVHQRHQTGLRKTGFTDVVLRREAVLARWPPRRHESANEFRLPHLIIPHGPGYMPLYCATQWIATRGGAIELEPTDDSVWKAAYGELLAHIASEEVTVTGVRNGERERVPGHIFAAIKMDYPFSDTPLELLLSDDLYLCSFAYVDEEHWHNGFDDSLRTRNGVKWSRLLVRKSDVAQHWPFASVEKTGSAHPTTARTGAPGRPSSMHLVEAEYRARWARGEIEVSMSAEAEKLAEWFEQTYPTLPRPTAKTIRTRLGAEHRQRKAAARK